VNTEQLYTDVLRNNLTYTLEGGIQVRQGRVSRQEVIQLIPPSKEIASNLQKMGVISERGVTPIYYIPNNHGGPEEGRTWTILNKVLNEYPVKPEEPGSNDDDAASTPLESRIAGEPGNPGNIPETTAAGGQGPATARDGAQSQAEGRPAPL